MSRSCSGFFYGDKMQNKKTVTVYIDGFNFYYGIKRSTKANSRWNNAYWIDIVKLCEGFISQDEVLKKVIYFTATPLNSKKSARQSAWLNANKLINKERFEVVRGKYLEKQITCPNCSFAISRPEEKKTDVNISVRMIRDCVQKTTDAVFLISADTDLLPPLELIKNDFPQIKIKILFPPSNYSHEISAVASAWKVKNVLLKNNLRRFENSIMSDVVENDNQRYEIPNEWKLKQELLSE